MRFLIDAALVLPTGFILAVAQNSATVTPKPIAQVNYRPGGKLIYVQATVNGSEPLWFILDSGAPDGSVATIRSGQGCPRRCPAAEVKQAGCSAFH